MEPAPYRSTEPEPAEVPGGLGALRSTHPGPRFTFHWKLVPLSGAMLLAVGATQGKWGLLTMALVAPLFFLLFLGLALWPMRRGRYSIALHANGLAVLRGERREEIEWANVDELWFELRYHRQHFARLAIIDAIRLVEHGGRSVLVPLPDDVIVAQTILRRCSDSLLADARNALASGEALHFGHVQVSRESITIDGATRRWDALSLVRFQPGRVIFFAGSRLWSWKAVRLDRVPHPALFLRFVRDHAKTIDDDDEIAADLLR